MSFSDNDSKCKVDRSGLCNFQAVFQNHEIIIERCSICHKQIYYNVRDGCYNEAKYRRDHIRDTLQPFGRTGKLFELIYGMKEVKKTMAFNDGRIKAKRSADEYQDEARDTIKTLKRTSVSF